MSLEIGSILDGKVTGITKFGAFVTLPTGQTGMVHISEIAHSYVNVISDHLTEGQEVRVFVMSVDKDGRISLSIKRAVPLPIPRQGAQIGRAPRASSPYSASGPDKSFEEKLKQFMQDSQSKMSDLNAGDRRMPRRGGRR